MNLISQSPTILSCESPAVLAKTILAQRQVLAIDSFTSFGLHKLDDPFKLKNMNRAVERLLEALNKKELIGIISDHDCDGQTACAVLTWSLQNVFNHPKDCIATYIGHRTEEGYGISPKLCDRILNSPLRPAVLLTADCGSSDHATIKLLAEHTIDVIVTDHHTVPAKGVPVDLYTIINPNQPGCLFPDKQIAGCFVAWFLMVALRTSWQVCHGSTLPLISPCLDFVAIGTMSDCVSLKSSLNNRIVLRYGLKLIRKQTRSCWRALKQTFEQVINSDFLIFKVIPLINADGRLFDALNGVKFLLAPDVVTAQEILAELIQTNNHRRHLQKKQIVLVNQLMSEFSDHTAPGIIVNLGSDGHPGIHGVTASRLLNEFNKVTILFSDHHEPGLLSGSARSPEGLSLKIMLDRLALEEPSLLKRYGGHHQAAGLCIAKEDFDSFKAKMNHLIKLHDSCNRSSDLIFEGIFPNDLMLESEFFTKLEQLLEPFGKDFKRPIFGLYASLLHGKVIGEDQNHLHLVLQTKVQVLKALFFFIQEPMALLRACERQEALFIGEFMVEFFQKKLQLSFFLKGVYFPKTNRYWQAQHKPVQAFLTTTPLTAKLIESIA